MRIPASLLTIVTLLACNGCGPSRHDQYMAACEVVKAEERKMNDVQNDALTTFRAARQAYSQHLPNAKELDAESSRLAELLEAQRAVVAEARAKRDALAPK